MPRLLPKHKLGRITSDLSPLAATNSCDQEANTALRRFLETCLRYTILVATNVLLVLMDVVDYTYILFRIPNFRGSNRSAPKQHEATGYSVVTHNSMCTVRIYDRRRNKYSVFSLACTASWREEEGRTVSVGL